METPSTPSSSQPAAGKHDQTPHDTAASGRRRVDPARAARVLRRSEWLVKFLDNAIPIPGTSQRLGFDAIIGLVPGVGDFVTTALGSYIIVEALRVRAPGKTVAMMVGNVALDGLMGAVPGLGDVADIFFRSNVRNLKLLRDHLREQTGQAPIDPTSGTPDVASPAADARTPRRVVTNEALRGTMHPATA